ncbi:hypothetical protein [Mycolicibacterium fallax]|uniref:Uncharacterized protein n=1 Tax=Mycolicibacterium fallax TaxID=1793 RepID=A0A1X1R2K6_MYCFA|nr:hypothetical protein [Mycolicibacterium fallax]ORU98513.1 hypothetical protein AWC04_18080 [Mycolicibacterium fallax]BBZ00374.1 hypothetical protein MFAL_38400 [Mycolicibacterium fallax]
MTVYEMFNIAVMVVVGLVAVAGIYLGLLNWFGGFHMVHCTRCHHLTGSTHEEPPAECVHCRHPMALHPFYAMAHRAAPIRVRPDPLHY